MRKQPTLLSFISLVYSVHASCPSGWLRHNNTCYHFSHDTEAWSNAVAMCHMLDGKLVEIETADENAFLASMSMRFNKNYWIALSDIQEEGIWVWMESKKPLSQIRFSHWHSGQPDNNGQNQNCATINGAGDDGHWYDWYCSYTTVYYICEKEDRESEIIG
ncbi:perlucin-like protein [Mercenaria mercenaria]|uniref:perlucin-like protein n=1 Tax=Mercenaria mercenaria TaxID=6596 RepID=UPI001E1D4747|nr:perlucin-like protein [Mercenaria mercenaria]